MNQDQWMNEAMRRAHCLMAAVDETGTQYSTAAGAAYDYLLCHLQQRPLPVREGTDEAEFEIHCNGDYEASACGPRAEAWREIQHYAAQYQQDGHVVIYEVTRTQVSASPSVQNMGEGGAPKDGVKGGQGG